MLIGFCISLFIIKNYFPVIPEIVIDCLLTLAIGGGIIYVGLLLVDIMNRDVLDFEKIDFGVLIDISNSSPLDSAIQNVELGDNDKTDCVGEACCTAEDSYFYGNTCNKCPEGLTWDLVHKTCVLTEKFSSFSPNPSFTPL